MKLRHVLGLAFGVALLLASSSAFAQGTLGYQITNDILEGEPVTLSISVGVALESLDVRVVRRKDKKEWKFSQQSIGSGNVLEFSWEQKSGSAVDDIEYTGKTMDGRELGGETNAEVSVVGVLSIEVDFKNTNLQEGKLAVRTDRAISNYELDVYAAEMVPIDGVVQALEKPTTSFTINWAQGDDVPVLMELKVTETTGIWAGLQIFRFEVPHEDVIFESGKHDIRDTERAKLEETLAEVQKALATYDRVDAQLYVSGYTDTVGSGADNQKLSQQRAKAIAKWFKSEGITIPIFYQGFGEDGLIVGTPDNTDEARNRRAVYTLANAPPVGGVNYPRANWKKLK